MTFLNTSLFLVDKITFGVTESPFNDISVPCMNVNTPMSVDKHTCKVLNLESLCKKHGDELALELLRTILNMTGFIILLIN